MIKANKIKTRTNVCGPIVKAMLWVSADADGVFVDGQAFGKPV